LSLTSLVRLSKAEFYLAFLLKYVRKEYALQKRRNIFVDALELLGYLIQVEEGRYLLNMDLDSEALVFSAKKD